MNIVVLILHVEIGHTGQNVVKLVVEEIEKDGKAVGIILQMNSWDVIYMNVLHVLHALHQHVMGTEVDGVCGAHGPLFKTNSRPTLNLKGAGLAQIQNLVPTVQLALAYTRKENPACHSVRQTHLRQTVPSRIHGLNATCLVGEDTEEEKSDASQSGNTLTA